MLRTINETFTEEEFEKLKTAKGNNSWHDFIMELAKNEGKNKAVEIEAKKPKMDSTEKLNLTKWRKRKR